MADRILMWLGAGILSAGVSAATIAGAGLAIADDGAAAGADGRASSASSNSADAEADSTTNEPSSDAEPGGDEQPAGDSVDVDDEDVTEEQAADDKEAVDTTESKTHDETAATPEPDGERSLPVENSSEGRPVRNVRAESEAIDESTESSVEPVAAGVASIAAEDETVTIVDTEPAPAVARVVMSAAVEEEPVPAPSLINVVGTFFWGLFDLVSKVITGPPAVPPGSTVTVGRSTLQIDCGDGYTAEADWYFPTEGETPTKLIYLQHGAFARAGLYNGTAAELAERNNAIVVAPSITSNFFACDACALGGDPMHAAVAKLFGDDRGALLASARAAGFEGTELPQRFVIAGHSGGGQLAGGAAGYYAESAPVDELHNLAGVLLLDTSPVGGAVERGVAKIPEDIPVYAVSAAPGVMNIYGGVDEVLVGLRPGQFVGVQLVGGVHGDAWQSTNAAAQFVVGLGTGFPAPQNVEAVQVLAQGWINDWFTPEDPDTGVYGDLGSVIDIPTDAGTAEAYVLPAPQRQLNLIELFVKALFESSALLTALQTCAAVPGSGAESQELTKTPTPNTALSLDGRASTGQSVGQHVCEV